MADAAESSAPHGSTAPHSDPAGPIALSDIEASPAPFPSEDTEDITTDTSVTTGDQVGDEPRKVIQTILTNVSLKGIDLQ